MPRFDVMCSLTSADALRFIELKQNQKTTANSFVSTVSDGVDSVCAKVKSAIADVTAYMSSTSVTPRFAALAA